MFVHRSFLKASFFAILFASTTMVLGALPVNAATDIPSETIRVSTFHALDSSESERFFASSSSSSSGVTALSTLSLSPSQTEQAYATESVTPTFDFNAVGLKWQGDLPEEDSVHITVVYTQTDGSIERIAIPVAGDDLKESLPENLHVTAPVFVHNVSTFYFEITLYRAGDDSPTVQNLDVVYFDSRPGVTTRSIAGSSDDLNIISRTEWGADDSFRYDKDGNESWEREYADPTIFVVHHTAGGDGGDDPAATIRGIYYWHAVVLGWGDIGYNYLIDPDGRIYKGRAGDDGVVAGHAYDSARGVSYNVGSIGIVLLGCYESTGACDPQTQMTPQMEASLEELIGTKAEALDINLHNTTDFVDLTGMNRVVGHRDLDSTYCPGDTVHTALGDVLLAATNVYDDLRYIPWAAKFQTLHIAYANDASTIAVNDNEDAETGLSATAFRMATESALEPIESTTTESLDASTLVARDHYRMTVSYKNTGDEAWAQDSTFVKIFNGTGKKRSSLEHKSWKRWYGKISMNETSVAPGESATFTFDVNTPNYSATKKIVTKLYSKKSFAKKSKYTSELTFLLSYGGVLTGSNFPVAIFEHGTTPAAFTFRNDGEATWDSSVQLMINGTAVAQYGVDAAGVDHGNVAKGESRMLSFDFTAPDNEKKKPIVRTMVVKLEHNGVTIPGTRTLFLMGIHPK